MKNATKVRYMEQRIMNAQKAVDQYSMGRLSEMEKRLGCDVNVLLKNWTESLNRQLIEYKEFTGKDFNLYRGRCQKKIKRITL